MKVKGNLLALLFSPFRITFGIYAATSAASQMTVAPSLLQPQIAGTHLPTQYAEPYVKSKK